MKALKKIIITIIGINIFYFLFNHFTGLSFFDFYTKYVRNSKFGRYYLDLLLLVCLSITLIFFSKNRKRWSWETMCELKNRHNILLINYGGC